MKKKFLAVCAACYCVLSGSAFAQGQADWRSKSPYDFSLSREFEAVDRNDDGYLDVTEIARYLPYMNLPSIPARLGDGQQNLKQAGLLVGKMDTNSDGKLSFREYRKIAVPSHYSDTRYGAYKNEPGVRSFVAADVNNDGFLTMEEYLALRGFKKPYSHSLQQEEYQRVRRYDSDRDGMISFQEYRYNFLTRTAR